MTIDALIDQLPSSEREIAHASIRVGLSLGWHDFRLWTRDGPAAREFSSEPPRLADVIAFDGMDRLCMLSDTD